jgi:hypothetical protein
MILKAKYDDRFWLAHLDVTHHAVNASGRE